jgi:hypothetical protein
MTSVSSRAAIAHLPRPAYVLRLRMPYEEYLAWAPDNMFAEWANGDAETAMPATHLHQRVIMLFAVLLDLFVRGQRLGMVLQDRGAGQGQRRVVAFTMGPMASVAGTSGPGEQREPPIE